MKRCATCGEESPPRFKHCGFCGAALPQVADTAEQRKFVTLLFCDLKGYTNLGEELDPERMRQVFKRYLDSMRGVIESNGGWVESIVGDAITAVFGVPRLHEDDALRAVRTARQMQTGLAALNDELSERFGVRLANRIGVNTGEVVVGYLSNDQLQVNGDAINVAARLQTAAPTNAALLGPETYRLVRHAVTVEELEPIPLKGKSEPVPAYRLIAVRDHDAVARRHDAPIVGRVTEVRALFAALDMALAGKRCEAVTILAAAGLGKTRLAGEFISNVASEVRAVRGRCLPYGQGITFWALAEIVRGVAGIEDGDSLEVAGERLRSCLDADADAIAERLLAALGLTAEGFPLAETFWAARRFFEQVAAERPLLVLWEDMHWAEPTLLDLVQSLIDSISGASVLFLVTGRPELAERHPDWLDGRPNAARVALEPLSEAETALIVEGLLGEHGLPPAVHERVAQAAGGNPLFVEQLVSMLVEEGRLKQEGGRWVASPEAGEFRVPPTIAGLLAARIDRLPPHERRVLQTGAVAGEIFYRGSLPELIASLSDDDLQAALDGLTSKQLVRPIGLQEFGETGYRFHHLLVRDAAYRGLLKSSRAQLHERFADWLERMAATRAAEFQEILGYHLEQASLYTAELGEIDAAAAALRRRASGHLAAAGHRALSRGDTPAAAGLLMRAADLLPATDGGRLALAPDLGEALVDLGRFTEAEMLLAAADEAAGAAAPAVAAGIRLARVHARYWTDGGGWNELALTEAGQAIPVFEAAGDHAALARAFRLLATVHGTSCHYAEAERAASRAVAEGRLTGESRLVTRNLAGVALAALFGPMPVRDAIRRCEEVLELAAADRRVQAIAGGALAQLYAMDGRFEDARALYRQCRVTLDDLGSRVFAAANSLHSARVELLAGDPAAAEADLRRDYVELQSLGERSYASTLAGLLAEALWQQGRIAEADELSRASRDAAGEDDVETQIRWRGVQAKVLAARGDDAAAEHLAHQGVEWASLTDAPVLQALAQVNLAETLRLLQRDDEAPPAVRAAQRLFAAKGDRVTPLLLESDLRSLAEPALQVVQSTGASGSGS